MNDEITAVINPEEASKIMGFERRTLDNWRSAGKGPAYVKLSRRKVGYLLADIQTFIQSRRIEPQN
jgi:predicted DNA-binding transcriptional regulator AlpA